MQSGEHKDRERALDILGTDRAVVLAIVDEFVARVGRIVSDPKLEVDFVI